MPEKAIKTNAQGMINQIYIDSIIQKYMTIGILQIRVEIEYKQRNPIEQ